MGSPDLYLFAISHYCEKARWGLDALGIVYALRHLPPGVHMQVTQELGAPGSSLPVLVSEGEVVQGSGAILDWAEACVAGTGRSLSPDSGLAEECRAIEARLDDGVGVHARRYYYSEAMVEQPETVLPIFTRDLTPEERSAVEENWELVRTVMIDSLDLGPEQGSASRHLVEQELDWLDGLLADGRRFLLGDRFSRADITAASLISPLVLPVEHPTYAGLAVPPGVQGVLASWSERPTIEWVRATYRDQRR